MHTSKPSKPLMRQALRWPVRALMGLAVILGGASVVGAADPCEGLPRSALKTRSCDPQADCLGTIPRELQGAARAAREKECSRLPTKGMCYGPDKYDPQADCRDARKR